MTIGSGIAVASVVAGFVALVIFAPQAIEMLIAIPLCVVAFVFFLMLA